MVSQEDEVGGTEAEDTAKFSAAWDDLEGKTGQPAQAAGREDGTDGEAKPGGDEAGQGEAQTGQSDAGATPGADADQSASRGDTDDGTASAAPSELDRERKERQRAENLARSNAGRLTKALNELDALRKQIASKAGSDDGEASDDEIAKLRQDYPEVADPLLKRLDKLTGQVEALSTTATARAESEVRDALTGELEVLAGLHPDFQSIVRDPGYAEWIKGQPPAIQRIVQENSKAVVSAADSAMVFDLYKGSKGQTGETSAQAAARAAEERRKAQLDAGRSASGGSQPGIRSDAGGDKSFGDEWDRLERQDQAKRTATGRR